MAELISLRGRNALSPFRVTKLLTNLEGSRISGIAAEFWHFILAKRPLTSPERVILERILTYGPRAGERAEAGEFLLVLPRPGTISPWASKATDIARNCGLDAIERIERGIAFRVAAHNGKPLRDADRVALLPLIHDRMTEAVFDSLDDAARLFTHFPPRPMQTVNLLRFGWSAIETASSAVGLALSTDEIDYLVEYFSSQGRDPTDVELMMFAQANSEHCRHKIFNAEWIVDGIRQPKSLFEMIRQTHIQNPQGTIVAYADNAAVMEGFDAKRFYPAADGRYAARAETTHIVMKVETHNHPTAIAPFPGAATGSGGEIRDEGATGIGARPKAGLNGFTVSDLRIPGLMQPWEPPEAPKQTFVPSSTAGQTSSAPLARALTSAPLPRGEGRFERLRRSIGSKGDSCGFADPPARGEMECGAGAPTYWIGKPDRIAPALDIMIEGPIGAASFNNEFGRPNLLGYFRTFEQRVDGEMRGYHKPIMIAGGVGNIAERDTFKHALPEGALIVHLGGPGMRIGMGGGAASSMATGANTADLDFDSVQRGNAEMERRAQEVIDRCWQLGPDNPILSIHDVGAGGLSNALPELVHGGGAGAVFNLRSIPSEEPGMSPREIWCNEAQERYVVAIRAAALDHFRSLCERERCPFAVVGRATRERRLIVEDPALHTRPVDMDLSVLLGKPPKMTRDVKHAARALRHVEVQDIGLRDAVYRILQLPAVADKTFLVTIGDRTVGGLCSRDPMVGPWQVPVSDVAVTLMDFAGYTGEAMAMGERTPLALIDGPASGRMAVGEALTNVAAAAIPSLRDVKLSANWMAPAGHRGEDAALYETVRAVAMELCPALGLSIPVGKDSMSMRTTWRENGIDKAVTAPVSLIVSAFARVPDARRVLTPLLALDQKSVLVLVDLGNGQNRLGGSALAQVYGQLGDAAPDVDDAESLKLFFETMQTLHADGSILAYHDRSDGGLLTTLLEMAFASRCGLAIDIDEVPGTPLEALFSEELGAVLQIATGERKRVVAAFEAAGLRCVCVGETTRDARVRITRERTILLDEARIDLHRAWSATTHALQRLRDNPEAAEQEFDRIKDESDPGLAPVLTFDPRDDPAAPCIAAGARPKIAVLREQGVNGHIEMAAAFDRAGFDAYDVHMSDLIAGRTSLALFDAFAAGGGFSYGDVLGAGEGWAKSILFNARARDDFAAFFARPNTFALGVCNGCQMMSNLHELIPGTSHWPHFVRNKSEQFEARLVLLRVERTPSLFFFGMEGSCIPVATARGEGYAEFHDQEQLAAAEPLVALRFVDNRGEMSERYPYNANGSPRGIAGLTTADGRFSILMPHPERVFRSVQMSWHPSEWGEDSPWMRMFRNARAWLG
ncbi:MAG: phosphoribosylformylglycinamidine synthase [Betaproteobacteria bacterium]|nr:MAG: phosphoribosylformylglycinamidine synthase [Betaproteobacteria bacterium]